MPNRKPDSRQPKGPDDEQTKHTVPVVRPDGGTTAGASPDDFDAPEYYAKDRKPQAGTPDASPSRDRKG